jgi:hemoglobin
MTLREGRPRLHPSGRVIPHGLDDEMVRRVVDDFYAKARRDPLIGPIFNTAIPEAEWPRHLVIIADFWSAMLLGTGRYKGSQMPKHLSLPGLADVHFQRWLGLFRETVDQICNEDVAALFVDRAERIAHSFRISIATHRGEDSLNIEVLRAPST